ncbi:MAG: hypothetical protein IPK39_19030 [Sulfuritalea sp.]|nr:hypothetical protein [Sulfuritalea sp.]
MAISVAGLSLFSTPTWRHYVQEHRARQFNPHVLRPTLCLGRRGDQHGYMVVVESGDSVDALEKEILSIKGESYRRKEAQEHAAAKSKKRKAKGTP